MKKRKNGHDGVARESVRWVSVERRDEVIEQLEYGMGERVSNGGELFSSRRRSAKLRSRIQRTDRLTPCRWSEQLLHQGEGGHVDPSLLCLYLYAHEDVDRGLSSGLPDPG